MISNESSIYIVIYIYNIYHIQREREREYVRVCQPIKDMFFLAILVECIPFQVARSGAWPTVTYATPSGNISDLVVKVQRGNMGYHGTNTYKLYIILPYHMTLSSCIHKNRPNL